jgi:hypothetical protein
MTTRMRRSRMLAAKSCITDRLKCSHTSTRVERVHDSKQNDHSSARPHTVRVRERFVVLDRVPFRTGKTSRVRSPPHRPDDEGHRSLPRSPGQLDVPTNSQWRWPMRINAAASTYKRMCNGTLKESSEGRCWGSFAISWSANFERRWSPFPTVILTII